ncbi:MAG: hypothetical protein ACMXX9_03595 [Candidatus Woesearchaeota archaeon]
MFKSLADNIKSSIVSISNTLKYLDEFSYELESRFNQTKKSYNELWDKSFNYHLSSDFKEFEEFTYTLTDNLSWYNNKMSDLENNLFNNSTMSTGDIGSKFNSYDEADNSFDDLKHVLDGGLRSQGIWSWEDRLDYVKNNADKYDLSSYDDNMLRDYLFSKEYLFRNKKDVFYELLDLLD